MNDQINNNQMNKKHIRRWGIVLMIPLVLGFMGLCILGARWKGSLTVRRVVIDGSGILSAQQLFTLSDVPLKSLMNQVDIYDVRGRILQQPFVKNARVTRQYPDAVRIQLVERQPIASVNNGQLRYIDAEAVLLPYIETSVKLDLPIINGVDSIQGAKPGETISNAELSEAIGLLQTALALDSTLFHFISEVNMNNGKDIILYSSDVPVPVIVGRGDYGKKLLMLETFWKNYVKTQSAQKIRYIDLRFNDQVVVKWLGEQQQAKTGL